MKGATGELIKATELLRLHEHKDIVIADRAIIVVRDFDWKRLRAHLEAIVARCVAPQWTESVERLRRYFDWEYDDMKGA